MNDAISNTFSALADPTRRAILARLALGETSVTELAEPFEMSMPAVSKHLRVLENAGLVERSRQAQYRPVKLRAEPLRQAWGWIEEYRQFWEESFDRLDEYLKRLQAEIRARRRSRRRAERRDEMASMVRLAGGFWESYFLSVVIIGWRNRRGSRTGLGRSTKAIGEGSVFQATASVRHGCTGKKWMLRLEVPGPGRPIDESE